jgi:hypothetical protein
MSKNEIYKPMISEAKQKILNQILKLKLVKPLDKVKIQKLQQELDKDLEEKN